MASISSLLINVFGTALILGVAGGMLLLARRIEPHRVGRNGQWFTANARTIERVEGTKELRATGWREARIFLLDDDAVELVRRSRSASPITGRLHSAAEQSKGRLRYYSLDTDPMAEFRIPAKSKIRAELDRRVRP